MNDLKFAKKLMSEVQRFRIASIALLLDELPRSDRDKALTVLQTNSRFLLFTDSQNEMCVCQHRQRHPHTSMIARYITMHCFCRGSKVKRNLLTKQSVKQYFPTLFRHGLPWGYYVDASNEKPVLGLLRVDTHLLQVNRIWQRTLDLLETHQRSPAFRKLIVGHQFAITWAVATPSKQDAIRYLASKKQHGILVEAQHFPCLLNQLAPLSNTLPDVVGL